MQPIVWLLFFLSGACGLVYEVLWCRQLGLIFGNTVQSISAVLTAFMAGLALGSYVSGRLCHRLKRPLFAYGVLELMIGLYCASLPWLFSDHGPIVPLYRSLYGETGSGSLPVVRFAISFVLLLIPTTFMGATLPVLSHYLSNLQSSLGKTVGSLYAANTFGAVVGAAATGFFLLPELGKAQTNWVAVGSNVMLGLLAINFGLRYEQPERPEGGRQKVEGSERTEGSKRKAEGKSLPIKLTVAAFALTGFAGMATQIGWTRAISLGTGSSTYAFSLIVSVFILGLSLGGAWAARLAARSADPLKLLATVLVMIGLLGLAIAALMGYGPIFFFFLLAWTSKSSWSLLLLAQAAGIAALILFPTFLMGATLPLTMQVASNYRENAGRTVGTLYAVNTVGAILGSFLGGLVLLPALSIQYTLVLTALMYAVPGIVLLYVGQAVSLSKSHKLTACATVLLLVALFALPRWDPMLMSSGVYLLRDPKMIQAAREFRTPDYKTDRTMLYYKEGAEATVAVAKIGEVISLSVGGKPDASSHDMATQIGLTLVPEVLHPTGAKEVLVIGLGSGVSAGAALAPASVQRVDVVEMSPEVVEASKEFAPYSLLNYTSGPHPTIDTPRVQLMINDARNHLLLTSRKYDVISSEPSNPWMAGVGNLFTQEAFEMSRSRLKPGGIMCQWVHSYRLDQRDFYSIIKTFLTVFPHAQLWNINGVDFLLIGSESTLDQPLTRLRERLSEPGIHSWLAKIHYETESQLLACFLSGERIFLTPMTRLAHLHTDDNMLLEFSAPRSLYLPGKTLKATDMLPVPEGIVDFTGISALDRTRFDQELDCAVAAREHARYAIEGTSVVDEHATAASRLAPKQLWPFQVVKTNPPPPDEVETLKALAVSLQKQNKWDESVEVLRSRCALAPLNVAAKEDLLDAFEKMGQSLASSGDVEIGTYLLRCARRVAREIEALGGGSTRSEQVLKELELLENEQKAEGGKRNADGR